MMEEKSIYSNRCWFEGILQPATVTFGAGKILRIVPYLTDNAENVGDDILMPGIIDAHVHINEPGRTDWEGFETATRAAAAGGITTVIDMPLNSSPVTTSAAALHEKLNATADKLSVNVGFYGGLVPGNIGELDALIKAGVMGIKCFLIHSGIDEFPNVGEKEVDQAMPILKKFDVPLLAHCELYDEPADNDLANFPGSYKEYLASRPRRWENKAVELMVALCRKHHCPTHIVHVSSSEALSTIANAKKEGLPLTAETCAHYILFNAESINDHNTLFKCAPPIREEANNNLLKEALATGVLDFITTDHSPAPPDIKQIETGNFDKGWGGIAGLQFLLPASWTALRDTMALEKFIPLLTIHPAKFLKIEDRKGKIEIGYNADLVVWRPEGKQVIAEDSVLHRHKISPYVGQELYGTVQQTIVMGRCVYKNLKVDLAAKNGTVVLHKCK